MTTAEKRAFLEASDKSWPDCDCHGRPMHWQRNTRLRAGGRFRCRVGPNERRARQRATRRESGLCLQCGGPLATETMCQSCADRHADLMATPGQRLKNQFAQSRRRRGLRADDGFRPTGVGQAALAAAFTEGKDE